MRTLIDAIQDMVERHDRFAYDLRARCRVLTGTVAAYRAAEPELSLTDPEKAIARALDHDGILGAWRDPDTGEMLFRSCRVFTGQEQALRFAEEQEQHAVFNLNRMIEVPVSHRLHKANVAARSGPRGDRAAPLRA